MPQTVLCFPVGVVGGGDDRCGGEGDWAGVDGGGAGQKKQDPSHFSTNKACLHLKYFSMEEVNSAWQNAGSASPHGSVGGAGGGGGVVLLMLRNWTRRRVLRICMLARRTITVVALCTGP